MTFEEFMAEQLQPFNDYMVSLLHPTENDVEEAMLYSIQSGGKRIRPLFILALVQSFGQNPQFAYDVAAAIEWIHTYSLIHDDLPAIDDDDLRRGQPTNHKVYGEATAILAGDALLTHAFGLVSQSKDLNAEQKVQLITALSNFAGTKGMIGGQLKDIQSEHQKVSLPVLESIHERKTGALIRFSFYAGAICAKKNQKVIDILDQVAQHVGLAFQIRDDILDVVGDVESLGKNPGQDEKLDKSTYPSLIGLSASYDALNKELDAAQNGLKEVSQQDQAQFNEGIISDFIESLRLEEA